MPYCIYTASDLTTDKKFDYIGLTTQKFHERVVQHKRANTSSLLSKAINENGKENIVFEEFYYLLNNDKDYLKEIEQKLIEEYQTHCSHGGYNKSLGGEGTFGFKHTDEERKRRSEFIKANPIPNRDTPETRKKLSRGQSKYQQSKTPEQKKAFSEKMKEVRRRWVAENPDAFKKNVEKMKEALAKDPEIKRQAGIKSHITRKANTRKREEENETIANRSSDPVLDRMP